jgi:hypothetical protein
MPPVRIGPDTAFAFGRLRYRGNHPYSAKGAVYLFPVSFPGGNRLLCRMHCTILNARVFTDERGNRMERLGRRDSDGGTRV